MADIKLSTRSPDGQETVTTSPSSPRSADLRWDIIELLFFAYRDFVGDADHGLKVADLLEVLRITKQSLGRVLKQLLEEGYIVQKAGAKDRRERLLFATAKGEALVAQLAGLQTDRITRAMRELGPAGAETVQQFLRGMIDRDDPDKVLQAIFGTGSAT